MSHTNGLNRRQKREYTWYFQPVGIEANGLSCQGLDIDDECPDTVCADGVRRNLWRARNRDNVRSVKKSRDEMGLTIHIWCQEGNGQIRLSPLDNEPRLKKRKKKEDKNQLALF